MTLIHNTAIIDSKAELDTMVKVGPYAIIGPDVKICSGTSIGSHAVLEGNTTIGKDNTIGHFASIGGPPQDMKYKNEPTKLIIGDRNVIREFSTLHRGTVQDKGITNIGNDNWIMSYVHVAHDCFIGNNVIFSNCVQIAGHVQIDNCVVLGGMSCVHQFVRIGEFSMLGGASKLVQDLPPYTMASGDSASLRGLNIEGLKRRGFTLEEIRIIRKAYKLLYKQDLSLEDAKNAIFYLIQQQNEEKDTSSKILKVFYDFIVSTQRGIIR